MSRLTLCMRENEAKRVVCKACKAPRWDWQLHGRIAAILQQRDLNSFTLPQVGVPSLWRHMMGYCCHHSRHTTMNLKRSLLMSIGQPRPRLVAGGALGQRAAADVLVRVHLPC